MTLLVHTARITYAGPDRLDVTRKSGDPTFAPSWAILRPMLNARANGPSWVWLWPQYVRDYTAEMRRSYVAHRAAWDALLARESATLLCYCESATLLCYCESATLLCYCVDPMHCHRTVLAEILGKLGATVRGERVL